MLFAAAAARPGKLRLFKALSFAHHVVSSPNDVNSAAR